MQQKDKMTDGSGVSSPKTWVGADLLIFLEEGWVISHKNKQTSNEKSSGVNLLTGHRSIAIEIENSLIPENLVNDLCVFSHAHSYKFEGG